jgi:sugar phosphate isomerase/epimerase
VQLSCLPVSLYGDLAAGRLTLDAWFRTAASLGLDGADISVAHVSSRDAAYLDRLREQASGAGVRITTLVTYSDFTHPEANYRAQQIEEVRAWIDAGRRLGVGFLRLTAGQAHPEVSEPSGIAWAAEGLTACLDVAREAGVRLLYENHVRGSVWSGNDFTQPASRFLDVVRRTEGTGLEILFDTANCLVLHDDPFRVLDGVIARIGEIHLSDIRAAGTFEPTVLGTGAAPIEQLLRRVVASGFDGWISIEEASRTGMQGFRDAVAFADRAWIDAGGRPRGASAA